MVFHVIKYFILGGICILSFSIRLFPIIKYENMIHEYDPHFNYRTTKYLVYEGFYNFLNWFDDRSWYPLGRNIGYTIYPGLMLTVQCISYLFPYWSIRNICVFLGPIFSIFTCIILYVLTKEIIKKEKDSIYIALLASAIISICPASISRSTAGSYDNEAISIFIMLLVFYLWLKSIHNGSIFWSTMTSIAYFLMVLSWGGYVFIINLIPSHVFILMINNSIHLIQNKLNNNDVMMITNQIQKNNHNIYISYSTFYIVATILSMQVPFVGFNIIFNTEMFASHMIFGFLQIYIFFNWIFHSFLSCNHIYYIKSQFKKYIRNIGIFSGIFLIIFLLITYKVLFQWNGRTLSLFDPTYALKYVPIIASVSEHQPTSWSSFYLSFGSTMFFIPIGFYCLYKNYEHSYGYLFLIIYGTVTCYFAAIMNRLLLLLAPAAAIIAAIGFSYCLEMTKMSIAFNKKNNNYVPTKESIHFNIDQFNEAIALLKTFFCFQQSREIKFKRIKKYGFYSVITSFFAMIFLYGYVRHCSLVSSKVYSSTGLLIETKYNGIVDDFREAFAWLRYNTNSNDRIASWWDYGYQISCLANRTTIVDNNTWNNTQIATIGLLFTKNESSSLHIIKSFNISYILVVFGGVIGYPSDDLNKFPWFIRIAAGVFPGQVHMENYQNRKIGQFSISPTTVTNEFKNSLLYKLSYYRYRELLTGNNSIYKRNENNFIYDTVHGYDFVRQNIPIKITKQEKEIHHVFNNKCTNIYYKKYKNENKYSTLYNEEASLDYYNEVFTSKNWLVRIYKVKNRNLV